MNAYVSAAERYMTSEKGFYVVDSYAGVDWCDGVVVSHDGDDLVFTIVLHTHGDAFPAEDRDEWRGRCEDAAIEYLNRHGSTGNVCIRFDFCNMRVTRNGNALLRYHTNAMRDA